MITLNDILDKPPVYLGNVTFFEKVQEAFFSKPAWNESDITTHLFYNDYKQYPYINKGITLLRYINLIQEKDNELVLSREFNNKNRYEIIISKLINKLHHDNLFTEVFPAGSISYDIADKAIRIHRNKIEFRYFPIINLIRDLSTIASDKSDLSVLLPNSKLYLSIFSLNTSEKRKIISEQLLQEILEAERIAGKEAEEYVEQFEKRRLKRHKNLEGIQIISSLDVGAGYDIISYETEESTTTDRFIEVKSYIGSKPQFYWSRNEIAVAQRMGDSYYIYLVNRSNLDKQHYSPIIIKNPSKAILSSNEWAKSPNALFVQKKT